MSKSRNFKISDEMLMAYVDGELNDLDRYKVERAVGADPKVAERLNAHQTLKSEITAAISDAAAMPLSPDLMAAIEGTKNVQLPVRRRTPFLQRVAPMGLAAAAAVAAFMVLSPAADGPLTASNDTGLSPRVADALSTLPDQAELENMVIGESYLAAASSANAQSGDLCRSFTLTSAAETAENATGASPQKSTGLACRKKRKWRLVALVPEIPEGAYMPAGPEQPSPIEQLVAVMQKLAPGAEIALLRE